MLKALSPDQLRKTYDPAKINLEYVTNHQPLKAIIGQERAVKALKFGLGNKAFGFNVFISGYPGEGKIDAVLHFLKDLAREEKTPNDWCYVNNFDDPYFPKCLCLPTGKARVFKEDIGEFIEAAQKALIKAFESEEYSKKRGDIQNAYQEKEREMLQALDQKARAQNFYIKQSPVEITAVPLVEGKPMTDQEYYELPQEEREKIMEKQSDFKEDFKNIARKARDLEKEFGQTIYDLEQRVALFSIEALLEELQEKYAEEEEVLDYLQAIKSNILDTLPEFLKGENPQAKSPRQSNGLKQYEVNVIVDNSEVEGTPIIMELNPTHHNLFGKIEKESMMGALITDFTLIRAGALHKANGGYIVIPVEDLFQNPFSWDTLKRSLVNKELNLEDVSERFGFMTTKSLKPDPIPLNIQVILIGRSQYYYLLYQHDDDFKDLFKVKADFDISMEANEGNIRDFQSFITHLCKEECLLPLDASALATVLEHGHRLADHQKRISNRFGRISDLIVEAHHYAHKDGRETIDSEHLHKAIEERFHRSSLLQEKIQEYIQEGIYLIDIDGEKVGQVNGLAVLDLGDISFGRPSRITASIGVGSTGIMDIEREAKLGGPLHTKGILILSGFLTNTFGSDKPLTFSARLVFEQNYGGVDGDSASSTELYALLSALSRVPIRQGIAVTGSVNQKGEVQAIGGVNEKVEGFFEVCRQKGLTGDQGVLIPYSNTVNLALKKEVVQAVKEGKFNIWAVKTIQEGIEILTGQKAGEVSWDEEAEELIFEAGSIFEKVNDRLRELGEKAKASRKNGNNKNNGQET